MHKARLHPAQDCDWLRVEHAEHHLGVQQDPWTTGWHACTGADVGMSTGVAGHLCMHLASDMNGWG